ncbi:hypothetical protein AVEN_191106-1 [Araneus ventricosus]|uniref:Endonuclease/exonuclease/phosphatase domain-containing protein n=1 Tax=Araneus ventricosus TaxID=182803 RepID=A0A4Y2AYK0_ARAVE|nr:hypothetical protein AVEN_191106-1 [Araneus ventricosus]
MNFIDSIPNEYLSEYNRKTLREYMVDFMSMVARQQAVMCMNLSKCHEQTDLIEDKLEKLQSTNEESIHVTYAAATKIRLRSVSRWREKDEGKLVLLKPKREGEKINIKKKLQETIDPTKIKVAIRNDKNMNKGGILIECATKDEIDKLRAEVESNENLREEIVIRRPIKFRSKLIICRMEEDLDKEESIVNLRHQNEEHKESDLKHEHIMKTNKGNHWIVSIDPESFQKIIKVGKDNLEDILPILQQLESIIEVNQDSFISINGDFNAKSLAWGPTEQDERSKELLELVFRQDLDIANDIYCSATDSETTTFGRFYTGKGCQAMSHINTFPEFFVRSRLVKFKHHPSILHFPPVLMKITPPGACAKARRVSESVAKQCSAPTFDSERGKIWIDLMLTKNVSREVFKNWVAHQDVTASPNLITCEITYEKLETKKPMLEN